MNLWRDGIFTALNIKCSIRHAHLFFPCSLTNRFWSLLFALFDGDWVAFFSYLFFLWTRFRSFERIKDDNSVCYSLGYLDREECKDILR